MTEVRRIHHPDCSYGATTGPGGDFCNCNMVVQAPDYDALVARVQAVERELQAIRDTVGDNEFSLRQQLAEAQATVAKLEEENAGLRASCHSFDLQVAELQGSVNRAGMYIGEDIAEKKQLEQQVERLREKGWALLERLSGTTYPNAACVAIDELAKVIRETGAGGQS